LFNRRRCEGQIPLAADERIPCLHCRYMQSMELIDTLLKLRWEGSLGVL
jgi:hypothetical protein